MISHFLLISSSQDWRSLTQQPKSRGLGLGGRVAMDFLLSFYPSSVFTFRPLGLNLLHHSRSPANTLVLIFEIVRQRAVGYSVISVRTHHLVCWFLWGARTHGRNTAGCAAWKGLDGTCSLSSLCWLPTAHAIEITIKTSIHFGNISYQVG